MKVSLFIMVVSCVLWAGCAAEEVTTTQETAQVVAPLEEAAGSPEGPAARTPKPETLRMGSEDRFALDREQEVFSFPVNGASNHSLLAHLADREGRRSISYLRDGAKEELASADWHLPPVGAMSGEGESQVCYNRLVGQPSERTEGEMPDPTQGVHLFCRYHDGEKWDRERRLGAVEKAAWVQSVTALADGSFRVVYVADEGWLVDLDPKHRVMSARMERGLADEPVMVRPYTSIQP